MEKFVSVKEFQIAALEKLKKDAGDYYRTGSGSEFTLRENQASFSRYCINL